MKVTRILRLLVSILWGMWQQFSAAETLEASHERFKTPSTGTGTLAT